MNANEYQQKAMRTLCDQHAARKRVGGAAGPDFSWLDEQPMIYTGPPCPSFGSAMSPHAKAYNTLIPIQALHAVIGLAGEVGELNSVLQKWLWYGKHLTLEELQRKVKDEAGDALWYISELLSAFGLRMQDVMAANIAKLAVRYPDRYSDERAADEARDRAAEAAAQTDPMPTGNAFLDEGPAPSPVDLARESGLLQHVESIEVTPLTCHHHYMLVQTPAGSGGKCIHCGDTQPT